LPQHYLHAANMYEIQKARLLRAPVLLRSRVC
jgi:hypothetical protein